MTAAAALDGVVVLDISQLIAGPLAAALLGDLGANVIKVEPPSGDKGRFLGPVFVDEGRSTTFIAANRNKRSIVVDAKSDSGRDALRTLIAAADVVITSFRSSTAKRLGLGQEDLEAINSTLISCSITGYGETGPLAGQPALDYAVQARSGFMAISGFEDKPVRVAVTVVDIATAQTAAQGVLAALFHRARSGRGQHIRVSLYDAALALQMTPLSAYLHTGTQPPRTGNATLLGAPADLFPTADGHIVVNAYFPAQWSSLCDVLGRPELAGDARFKDNELRLQHRDELFDVLSRCFETRTTAEWLTILERVDIVASPICTYADVEAAEQTRINQMIVERIDPHAGRMRGLGLPLKMSLTPPSPAHRPAPKLGEHTAEILREFNAGQTPATDTREAEAAWPTTAQ
jgi:crotonobetainyl-CoA:carnitine CoA-transferase CaiB-like acyl-CoA transferase